MENWEICEKECFEYLKLKYANKNCSFEHNGGSDSTKSDILLKKNRIACFYIESKMPNAQCGQFVVLKDDERKTFFYSSKNHYEENLQSKVIIEEMNKQFDFYKNPGTKGIELDMFMSYFYDWVYHFYTDNKKAKYFIIEKELGNQSSDNFIIFPVQRLYKYITVNAKYRTKKSGSANPTENNFEDIKFAVKSEGFTVSKLIIKSKYVFAELDAAPAIYKMSGENYKYQFKYEKKNLFKVTRLARTCNSNVIFDISPIGELKQNEKDLETFEAEFKY